MQIRMGDIIFEMKYFGIFHSNSEILIYIPGLKILFNGDVLFRYGRPGITYEDMTDREQWLDAIAWTDRRMSDMEILVGGHGQILAKEDLLAFHQIILERTERYPE